MNNLFFLLLFVPFRICYFANWQNLLSALPYLIYFSGYPAIPNFDPRVSIFILPTSISNVALLLQPYNHPNPLQILISHNSAPKRIRLISLVSVAKEEINHFSDNSKF